MASTTKTSGMPLTVYQNFDECPIHGAEQKGEYTFGMQDATVYTYQCGCAGCAKTESIGGDITLYPDYRTAAGAARLIVALSR